MSVPKEACQEAATILGCDVAAIQAVAEVESGGRTNCKAFLFEPHWFSRLTNRAFDRTHSSVSYPKWDKSKYPKGQARLDQFRKACDLDRDKAHQAASWGLFQIMGFNHQKAGYASAEEMAQGFQAGVENNVVGFTKFIQASGMGDDLRLHRWASFARKYNGPAYAKNQYDKKLAAAHARYRKA
jgi:N-acetylmuramidase